MFHGSYAYFVMYFQALAYTMRYSDFRSSGSLSPSLLHEV